MCKQSSGTVSQSECFWGHYAVFPEVQAEPGRLLPVGKETDNRKAPENIRSSRRAPQRNGEKMFQQKLVIVIRTFLLFFLFQPSALLATTVEAGK